MLNKWKMATKLWATTVALTAASAVALPVAREWGWTYTPSLWERRALFLFLATALLVALWLTMAGLGDVKHRRMGDAPLSPRGVQQRLQYGVRLFALFVLTTVGNGALSTFYGANGPAWAERLAYQTLQIEGYLSALLTVVMLPGLAAAFYAWKDACCKC